MKLLKNTGHDVPVWGKFLIGCIVLLYFIQGLYQVTIPGLDYDELLFVNAALGNDESGHFITYKIGHWVILNYLYIGALKSWIYYPLFAYFGFSPLSVRLPVLVLSTINLLIAFQIGRKHSHWILGFLLLIWLSTDSSFLNLQRFDKGPTALETFFKLSTLWVLTWDLPRRKKLAWVSLILVLGVFNKFNFLWFVNALFASFQISYLAHAYFTHRSRKQTFSRFYLGVSAAYVAFLATFFLLISLLKIKPQTNRLTWLALQDRFAFYVESIQDLLSQRGLFQVFGWGFYSNMTQWGIFLMVTGLFLGLIYLLASKTLTWTDSVVRLVLLFFFLSCQYTLMPEADKIWHTFLIGMPFLPMLFLLTGYLVWQKIPRISWILLPLFVAWMGIQVRGNSIFRAKLAEGCVTELFKPEISQLVNEFQHLPPGWILEDDWGTHSQLLAYFWKTHQLDEAYRYIRTPKDQVYFYQKHQDRWQGTQPIYWVKIHPVGSTEFAPYRYNVLLRQPEVSANFLAFIQKKTGKSIRELKVITNACGVPIYSIYQFQ